MMYTVQFATFKGIFGIFDINYHQNPGTLTTVSKNRQEVDATGHLTCEVVPLSIARRFRVDEGDMIGVCLHGHSSSNKRDDEDHEQPAVDSLTTVAEASYITENLEYVAISCASFEDIVVLWIATFTIRAFLHVALEIGK